MNQFDVVAVGAPPTFRQQVARALERDPSQVEWMPSVTAAEAFLSEGRGTASVLALSPSVKEADAFGLADFVTRRAPATAVILVRERPMNGLLPADATLDAKTLSAIKMPNRNMFIGDPRPDVKNPACMKGC